MKTSTKDTTAALSSSAAAIDESMIMDACATTTTSSNQSSSSTSDYDEEVADVEEEDQFDSDSLKMSRIDSSSIPFVLEVAPRNGRLGSKDPLFQCVCLYDGSMTSEQVDKYTSKTKKSHPSATMTRTGSSPPSSWSLLSIFTKSV
jgi:hypothetical protein